MYLAINMYWERRGLALPKLPKGMEWELAFSTEPECAQKEDGKEESEGLLREVASRSIAVYVAK